jgi:hypothetical protein
MLVFIFFPSFLRELNEGVVRFDVLVCDVVDAFIIYRQ